MIQKLIRVLRGAGSGPKESENQKPAPEMIKNLSKFFEDSFDKLEAEFTAKEDLNLSANALPQKRDRATAPKAKRTSTANKASTTKNGAKAKPAASKPSVKKASTTRSASNKKQN